ncbi:rhodanese-like domain-containing protein [Eikenella longinqua]|nr:rhodanese-like domain-containing protein [Eikenella longinqua]
MNMHKLPTLAAIVLLSALPAAASAHGSQRHAHSQPPRAAARQQAVWIDVRSPAEYAQGHIQGAHNLPHDQIARQITAVAPDKHTPIQLYCRSGRRAEAAKQALESLGYTNVQNRGGYEALKQSGI